MRKGERMSDERRARLSLARTTHGLARTRAYKAWDRMISRCTNPADPKYPLYGGRGIGVCARWLDPVNFCEDMGEPPAGMTLERNDNNGNYEPGNCEWATPKKQANNTRRNRRITHNGETRTLTEWAASLGISPATLFERIERWGTARALTQPRTPTTYKHGRTRR